jgi:flagellar motor switch protein FliM
MSRPCPDNLSQEKVQQLLAAVGSVPQSDAGGDLNVVDYNWRQPQYFSLEQRTKLAEFAEKAAAACVDEFSRLYHGDVEVSVVSAAQCFQSPSEAENPQAEYCFAFGVDPEKPFGLMRIPDSSAALWTGHMLGGEELTEESGRRLSTLEESFLLDIASGLIKDFSRAYGSPLQLNRCLTRDESSIVLQGSQERFMVVLEVRKRDSEDNAVQAFILMCCDKLQSVAGKVVSEEGKNITADKIRAMREHLKDVPVSLTVRLAQTMLKFKDVVNLQVNDIVLLNKEVFDPVDVLIGGRTVFQGRPAQSGGKLAVVIV